ncbi:unnamed protein product [Phaeothamnion confervicola]
MAAPRGSARFRCAEVLFQPCLAGREGDSLGLHVCAFRIVAGCDADADLCRHMFGNILVAGGNTLLPEIAERLTEELTALVPLATKIHVVAPPGHMNSAWVGGSVFASHSTFRQMYPGTTTRLGRPWSIVSASLDIATRPDLHFNPGCPGGVHEHVTRTGLYLLGLVTLETLFRFFWCCSDSSCPCSISLLTDPGSYLKIGEVHKTPSCSP